MQQQSKRDFWLIYGSHRKWKLFPRYLDAASGQDELMPLDIMQLAHQESHRNDNETMISRWCWCWVVAIVVVVVVALIHAWSMIDHFGGMFQNTAGASFTNMV